MQKGITPVVAMILLLMMTVAAAGAAFAWTQGIMSGQQEEAEQELNTEITVRDLQCDADNGKVDFFLDNTGSATVSASNDVSVYLYSVSTGDLVNNTDTSRASGDISPGEFWDGNVSFGSGDMSNGLDYTVEFEFSNQGSYTVSDICQAE